MLQIVKDTFCLLTFRLTREEFLAFDYRHFIFGLICTWIVGIGRNWDNPEASLLQHRLGRLYFYSGTFLVALYCAFTSKKMIVFSYFDIYFTCFAARDFVCDSG